MSLFDRVFGEAFDPSQPLERGQRTLGLNVSKPKTGLVVKPLSDRLQKAAELAPAPVKRPTAVMGKDTHVFGKPLPKKLVTSMESRNLNLRQKLKTT